MRLLHIAQPPYGGVPMLVDLLIRDQVSRHEVGLVCHSSGTLSDAARRSEATVWTLPMHRRPMLQEDLRHLRELVRIVRDFRPDLVHAHSSKAGVLARIAARRLGVPVVLSPQNFAYRAYEGGLIARSIFYAIERMLAPLTDALHVVSRDEYEDAIRHGMISPERCGSIHNGIDTAPLLSLEPPSMWSEFPTIGTFARLWHQKRIDVFLRSVAVLLERGAHFHALVIGDGPDREHLRMLASDLGIANSVTFDHVRHDAVQALRRLDIFVLSSSHEACPLTVMEAMAAERPVVATRVGGVPEIVTDGESGLLVPSGSPDALANAIQRILGEPALGRRLAASARAKAARRFDGRIMAERMEALYATALGLPPTQLG